MLADPQDEAREGDDDGADLPTIPIRLLMGDGRADQPDNEITKFTTEAPEDTTVEELKRDVLECIRDAAPHIRQDPFYVLENMVISAGGAILNNDQTIGTTQLVQFDGWLTFFELARFRELVRGGLFERSA